MRLVEATQAQRQARDLLTASAWGRHLTVEQFCAREVRLRAHPFAVDTMRTWLWVDEAERVLSSCETFQLRTRREGRDGWGVLIASVFTEASLRGRGFATAMLDALCLRVQGEGALVAGLFSEVGPALYARCGFVPQPSVDVLFPAGRLLRACVDFEPAVTGPPGGLGTFELTAAQCDWHVERERFYAGALGRPAPLTHLARCGDSRCAWAASFQTNELHVLWYDVQSGGEAAALIAAARHVAHACGLEAVRVWETAPLPVDGGRRVMRTDELPMLRPLDGGPAVWTEIHRGLWA